MELKNTGLLYCFEYLLNVCPAVCRRVVRAAAMLACIAFGPLATAQPDATVTTRLDARHIVVGDQARLFFEVKNKPSMARVEWAAVPDTFNGLEVVERGKIDTIRAGEYVTYKQRLVLTGFDSGAFKVPSFIFPVIASNGDPYTIQSDSFMLSVQTVAVDTTKAFRPIKGVMYVDWSWMDYIWYIVAGLVFVLVIAGLIVYFLRRPKPAPVVPEGPKETLQQQTLRLLSELESKQLWQNQKVKEYYVELTDIVRNYVEARFNTPALEITTDELMYKVQMSRELQPYYSQLHVILTTADLAKFAKAQPLPAEHTNVMSKAIELVVNSKPVITPPPTESTEPAA